VAPRLRRGRAAWRNGEGGRHADDPGGTDRLAGDDRSRSANGRICHAPWSLISTRLARGRGLTSHRTLWADSRNAGRVWIHEPVAEDGTIMLNRKRPGLTVAGQPQFAGRGGPISFLSQSTARGRSIPVHGD
jgi:hypothetical protein